METREAAEEAAVAAETEVEARVVAVRAVVAKAAEATEAVRRAEVATAVEATEEEGRATAGGASALPGLVF